MTSNSDLRIAAALSTDSDTQRAVAAVSRDVSDKLDGPPDLAVVFVSHHYGPDFAPLLAAIREQTGARILMGCTGESIVGSGREIEGAPALSLWAARLPGTTLTPMRLEFTRTPEGGSFVGWPDDLPETWPADSTLLLLGDPFSFPADVLLQRLEVDQPGIAVLGGMASGAFTPGANRVFLGSDDLGDGAVAVLLSGGVRVRSVVSQGCRPIGKPMVITKADKNVIVELGGRPPLAHLQEVFDTLEPREQRLVQQGLHVGRVIDEYRETFGRGDFLVRNCVGADRETGAIAVGDFMRPGQTVQFHIRDAASADEDLRELLSSAERDGSGGVAGALLFTCNGRGTRLFPAEHHDAGVLDELWPGLPVAGFFAQGELGPVAGRNFMHGFTASVALFEPKR